ncbi:isoprenoid synthase domain-containing protein [Microdochium bolleyi]|uniref:Terpene synthase n=1 Tax=Microdochium bolleyi TaxID=196109 RepID=A0A136IKF8_9PEZI|nr:isoprenoid synthase domain-containing protein [Microdochium bolleyi]
MEDPLVIPDLFSSIMCIEPAINRNYAGVKKEADAWIEQILKQRKEWTSKNRKANFTFLASLWAADVDEEALKVRVDYNNWVICSTYIFLFDDQFDEGHLSTRHEAAYEEIQATLSLMDDGECTDISSHENPIRFIFQDTWRRFKKVSSFNFIRSKRASTGLQQRWRAAHRHYFDGILAQVRMTEHPELSPRTIDDYMVVRRRTVGASPILPLIEYAHNIQLPTQYFKLEFVQACMNVSFDLTCYGNDVLSYKKDLSTGCEHNLLIFLQRQGFFPQEALKIIEGQLNECYKRWFIAQAEIPIVGREESLEQEKFLHACKMAPLGQLHWG